MLRALERPEILAASAVVLLATALWIPLSMQMGGGAMGGGATGEDWSASLVAGTAGMWLLMMASMMLPSMAPMVATYASISAKESAGLALVLRVAIFGLGYFSLWAAFSFAMALSQLWLRDSAWVTGGGTQAVPLASAALLVAAGLYQMTPLKDACRKHCRSPMTFLLAHWRPGVRGAFPVGFHHGAYCVGCCGIFMGLMFVFGAMTVWSMAVLASYFVIEKMLPRAEVWGKAVGMLLIAAGLVVAAWQLV